MALKPSENAFPYRQMAVLAVCRLSEPIGFMSIVAYSFIMVQDIKGEKNASFWSNFLVSAFALAEASTAMFWGSISDRYGRKPIILLGLAGTAVSSLLFGFAKNYWFALFARILGGALNGNVAVMQTMVAEIVKRREHEAAAYSVGPFMWNIGSVLGSALGGFTAQPAKYYPRYFSETGIFGRYPYLLPNVISAATFVIAIVQGYFLLEETLQPVEIQKQGPNETSPLISSQPALDNKSSTKVRRVSFISGSAPIPEQPSVDIRSISVRSEAVPDLAHKASFTVHPVVEDGQEQDQNPKAFTKPVISWIVALVLMSCHQVAFGAILPVFVLDKRRSTSGHLDLLGGLGLTLHDVGTFLAVISVISLFAQGIVFPASVSWLGVWKSAIYFTILCPVFYLAAPFVSLMSDPRVGVYIVIFFQTVVTVIIYPCLLILLKDATASPRVLGRVNGLAMSACSAARTVSPPLVGLIYGTVGSVGAWGGCAVMAISACVELIFLMRPDKYEESSRENVAEGNMG